MSTRSLICKSTGYQNEVESKYCHWDGYPSWNGDLLAKHYNTEDGIDTLLESNGYLSSLGETLEKSKFITGENYMTDFHADEDRLLESANDYGVEYIYLFKEEEWYVTCTHLECTDVPYKKFILLSDVLKTL